MSGVPPASCIASIAPLTPRAAMMCAVGAFHAEPAVVCRAIETELAAAGFQIEPRPADGALQYPKDLTDPLRAALGEMIFVTGPIAHAFRADGHDIPNRAEDEQAFVLHWLIRLAIEHGAEWRRIAGAELGRIYVRLEAKKKEPQR